MYGFNPSHCVPSPPPTLPQVLSMGTITCIGAAAVSMVLAVPVSSVLSPHSPPFCSPLTNSVVPHVASGYMSYTSPYTENRAWLRLDGGGHGAPSLPAQLKSRPNVNWGGEYSEFGESLDMVSV